jgi:hypothetical protein
MLGLVKCQTKFGHPARFARRGEVEAGELAAPAKQAINATIEGRKRLMSISQPPDGGTLRHPSH